LELSAGSLGQGLSVALGMALAAKMDHLDHHIFCINGDGELQEGSVWEAAMAASHHKLGNLISIIDRNGLQIDGNTETVMALEPLHEKWKAFGWRVLECNGNNIPEILDTLNTATEPSEMPTVILAHTTMGKGVKSIEGDHHWHGKAPTLRQAADFIRQINEASA
jgi:transketolase